MMNNKLVIYKSFNKNNKSKAYQINKTALPLVINILEVRIVTASFNLKMNEKF